MKRTASLSLDLDNQWSYMKTHGDAGWEQFPSYLDKLTPRVLEFIEGRGLKITFFVVGQDAALEKNRDALRSIADAGHEVGNHSFNHEPWLHLYTRDELVDEFERTETAIETAAGIRPRGFRGPGYSLSPTVLDVLAERGYEYDCSTLPTFIGPLARAYYFLRSPEISDEEKVKRKKLFGNFSDGFQSLRPYVWNVGGRRLIEIPVTTMPVFKIPVHASYIVYLSGFSQSLARIYWAAVVRACVVTDTPISLLLHPLDFLNGEDVPELKFFPGMDLSTEHKLKVVSDMLDVLGRNYDIVNIREHARRIAAEQAGSLRLVDVPAMSS